MKRTRRFGGSALKLPMTRSSEVARARRQLQHQGWPRLQMALIVLLTGGAGFLASHVLRLAGLDSMLLRYPLAVLLAYAVFLLLMWIWIRWRWDAVADGAGDVASNAGGGGSTPRSGPSWGGNGGHSGGGGASASWGEASAASVMDSDGASLIDAATEHEAGLPLLAVLGILALVASVLLASAWVVWSAPVLMAELLVDAAIVGGLYRRMQGMGAQGWWRLCLSHTFWPLLGLLVFFAGLGWVAQQLAPGAVSLMQVVQAL
ncbi:MULTISPECIES: hypothetical protein [Stenotrophomonas]|uniref:hypothetical protein n=1 Tax=Stenotrophomonas TaxID=40323 RepID=UPI000D53CD57|nr:MULTISPECIES: hypothetical protein [Stenotrophomonas]AWH44491.1 hypothetical protein C1926_05375 [Stenotrophomonas sp. ZAC14A_NAIMI4_1]